MMNRGMPNLFDHLDAVRRYARVVGCDAAHVDDLAQECLMRALSRPRAWQEVCDTRAYLLALLHDAHVEDAARRRSGADMLSVDPTRPESADAAGPARRLPLRDLVRALQVLPEGRRLSRPRGRLRDAMNEQDPVTGAGGAPGRHRLARTQEKRRANAAGVE